VFDLIVPHFRLLVFRLLWSMGLLRLRQGGLLFRLRRLVPPLVRVIPGVAWRARTPVPVVSAQVTVVVKGVRIVVIVIAVLVVVLVESIVGPPVLSLGTNLPVLSQYMLSTWWFHVQNTNTFLDQNMLSAFRIH
jgi:hypothetical protein